MMQLLVGFNYRKKILLHYTPPRIFHLVHSYMEKLQIYGWFSSGQMGGFFPVFSKCSCLP